jgi:hypothetical protein
MLYEVTYVERGSHRIELSRWTLETYSFTRACVLRLLLAISSGEPAESGRSYDGG